MKKLLCIMLALLIAAALTGCGDRGSETTDFEDTYVDALPENAADGLTLHAFNWTYREIETNLEAIRDAGFKNVLTMPVQQPKGGGSAWWAFYQPLSFSIGDSSALGTKEELASLCAKAEEFRASQKNAKAPTIFLTTATPQLPSRKRLDC